MVVYVAPYYNDRPKATFGNQPVLVVYESSWYAVVGLPLGLIPGDYVITVKPGPDETLTRSFRVSPAQYPIEQFAPTRRQSAQWTDDELDIFARQAKELRAALRVWQERDVVTTALQPPVQGSIVRSFGVHSLTGEAMVDPFTAVEFTAVKGTPLVATGDGVIDLIQRNPDGRLTVLINHGQGLFSVLIHLTQINLKSGQKVSKGERIGTISVGGKNDNAHILWSVVLNETEVDPMLLVHSNSRPESIAQPHR